MNPAAKPSLHTLRFSSRHRPESLQDGRLRGPGGPETGTVLEPPTQNPPEWQEGILVLSKNVLNQEQLTAKITGRKGRSVTPGPPAAPGSGWFWSVLTQQVLRHHQRAIRGNHNQVSPLCGDKSSDLLVFISPMATDLMNGRVPAEPAVARRHLPHVRKNLWGG